MLEKNRILFFKIIFLHDDKIFFDQIFLNLISWSRRIILNGFRDDFDNSEVPNYSFPKKNSTILPLKKMERNNVTTLDIVTTSIFSPPKESDAAPEVHPTSEDNTKPVSEQTVTEPTNDEPVFFSFYENAKNKSLHTLFGTILVWN